MECVSVCVLRVMHTYKSTFISQQSRKVIIFEYFIYYLTNLRLGIKLHQCYDAAFYSECALCKTNCSFSVILGFTADRCVCMGPVFTDSS